MIALVIATSCSGGGGSGDSGDGSSDDENDGGGESCSSDTSGMVEIPFAFQGSDCAALGLAVVVDHVFANATLTQFVLNGQFSIDNDNAYYLRGAGLTDGGECYDEIENSGEFAVRTNYLECEELIEIEVLAKADSESTAFCRFGVRSEIGCDDADDDDTGDDDSQEDCESTLDGNVEACFEGLTTADVCAQEDADCWVACFASDTVETCEDWLDCLVSDCGYSASDDDTDYVAECEEWYAECGVDDAGVCASLGSYTGLGACYDAALGDLFDCLIAAGCSDAEAIADCYTDFASAAGGC